MEAPEQRQEKEERRHGNRKKSNQCLVLPNKSVNQIVAKLEDHADFILHRKKPREFRRQCEVLAPDDHRTF